MASSKIVPVLCLALSVAARTATAQSPSDAETQLKKALATIQKLADQVAAQDSRLRELEAKQASDSVGSGSAPPAPPAVITPEVISPAVIAPPVVMAAVQAVPAQNPTPPPPADPAPDPQAGAAVESDVHDHMVQLPGGGPALKIRGFFDFNFGLGTDTNPLIFPLPPRGRSTFQVGEADLFLSSKLSKSLSFVGELIWGSDVTNEWGVDIERIQLTWKASKFFEVSGGRYHTAIGYYNTAFHHGTWFQTVNGRPFMYFFEDSGGLLPVHGVGMTTTGLVPGSGSLGLHWIAEVSNGHASDPNAAPVQNFSSDRTSKALNFAAYIKPHWAPGLQIGGSYFLDRLYPLARVDEHISSAYLVYNNSTWEFMAEGVLLSHQVHGAAKSYNSPLTYGQISRKFGLYRPYFRYQYVHSIPGDPINQYTGRYEGPSIGIRREVSDYAAFKLQYNRLLQDFVPASNGLTAQIAFTF